MDLYCDIEKATHIPWVDQNISFLRIRGLDQATRDHKMNKRRLRPARNINLIEEDNSRHTQERRFLEAECIFNEYEVRSSIKAVHDGVSYSNSFLVQQWKSKQENKNIKFKNSTESFNTDSIITDSNDKKSETTNTSVKPLEDTKIEFKKETNYEEVFKKSKLSRNAVIVSLLKRNIISVMDLQLSNIEYETQPYIQVKDNVKPDNKVNDDKIQTFTVEHPEDPDVFINELQITEDVNKDKWKDIDFTVAHVGNKKTITPQQFYINEFDESNFNFVKGETKKE